MSISTANKDFLMGVVAAALQDLRPPKGLDQDPMPGKNAASDQYDAWVGRHTIPQRSRNGTFLGDALYDHYTARAVLGGMPFEVMGKSFTLQEALLNLGVEDPEARITVWKKDLQQAADVGDRLMNVLTAGSDRKLPDTDDEEQDGMPYGVDRKNEESEESRSVKDRAIHQEDNAYRS